MRYFLCKNCNRIECVSDVAVIFICSCGSQLIYYSKPTRRAKELSKYLKSQSDKGHKNLSGNKQ